MTGSSCGDGSCFCFRRYRNQPRAAINATPTTGPTTAPAIQALLGLDGLFVMAADSVDDAVADAVDETAVREIAEGVDVGDSEVMIS